MISFLTAQASQSNVKKAVRQYKYRGDSRSDSSEPRKTTTLRESERELIARVLSESKTLTEAASKLGIADSTLWRKRKRYRLE